MINLDENSFPYWERENPEWEYLGSYGYKNFLNIEKLYDLYYRKSIIGEHLLAKYNNGSLDSHLVAIRKKFANPFPPLAEAYRLYKRKYNVE